MLTVLLTEALEKIFATILLFFHVDSSLLEFLPELEELIADSLTVGGIVDDLCHIVGTCIS